MLHRARPFILTYVLLGQASTAQAQRSSPQPAESLVAVVSRFFVAMENRDSIALRTLLEPQGHVFALLWRKDSVDISVDAHAEMVTAIVSAKERWRERIWNPTVLQHGPLAVVWAPYDFYLDTKFSHCGVDTFTLVRRRGGWRIADVAFTMEPEGCKPSPLGPRR